MSKFNYLIVHNQILTQAFKTFLIMDKSWIQVVHWPEQISHCWVAGPPWVAGTILLLYVANIMIRIKEKWNNIGFVLRTTLFGLFRFSYKIDKDAWFRPNNKYIPSSRHTFNQ